ncbi:uncharacterized protein EI90DRAFT_3042430 [Cantharellus anzutake]|uniref:uncharacterized protein n=1 Tax=Cantharellus anzutake TaxID=1750568 RepID=UPI001904C991|nr:uncharacterized protein EI90DRAFT_3042430 [Cantharellus anzutake]KAF8338300.1 hypothetical protein EI90DRAFT_3042430 [Cantharellus anzutake]
MEWELGTPSPIPRKEKHWLLDSDSDDGQLQSTKAPRQPSHTKSKLSPDAISLSSHSALSPIKSARLAQQTDPFMNRILKDTQPPCSVAVQNVPELIDISTTVEDINVDTSQPIRRMGARGPAYGTTTPGTPHSSPDPLGMDSLLDLSQPLSGNQKKRALLRGRRQTPSPSPSLHFQLNDPDLSPGTTSRRRKTKNPERFRRRERPPLWDHQNGMVEMEAVHSGDDISEGCSGSDGQREDEYDREFIADDSHVTQVNSSYDQSAIYRQGLLTQAPRHLSRAFGPSDRSVGGRWAASDSSPSAAMNLSEDQYSIGSFVAADDEPVSYFSDE